MRKGQEGVTGSARQKTEREQRRVSRAVPVVKRKRRKVQRAKIAESGGPGLCNSLKKVEETGHLPSGKTKNSEYTWTELEAICGWPSCVGARGGSREGARRVAGPPGQGC